MPWIRFTVSCGDEPGPWLVTPKLTRQDLEQVNGDYLYIVE